MAWAKSDNNSKSIDELIKKALEQESLIVMPMRKFGDEEAILFCLNGLSKSKKIKEFITSGHKISPIGAAAFADALAVNSSLVNLNIGDSTFGDESLKSLCSKHLNKHIKILHLEYKGLSTLSGNILKETLPLTNIVELQLSRNKLDDDAVIELSKGISKCVTLTKLDLSSNSLGSSGFIALCESIQTSNIKHLNVSYNLTIGPDGAEAIRKNQIFNKVEVLIMNQCCLGDDGAIELGKALIDPKTVISILEIGGNSITHEGFEMLINGITKNTSIKEVRVNENAIGLHGIKHLASALTECTRESHFEHIDISRNYITVDDSKKHGISISSHLTQIVVAKKTKKLSLLGNAIGEDAITALGDVLEVDSILQALDLNGTGVSPKAARYLLDKLHKNSTLCLLEIGGNDIGSEGEDAISRLKDVNKVIDVARDKGNTG